VGGVTLTEQLMNWVTNEQKIQIRPRFTFKRKLVKNMDNSEAFDMIMKEEPNVDPSYFRWCQSEIIRQVKEDIMYVAEEPMEGIGAATQVRNQSYELPDGQPLNIGN